MKHLLVLCLLFLTSCRAQISTTPPIAPPDWTGDPSVCTVDPNPPQPTVPYPKFPSKAEFTLEQVVITHLLNITLPSQLTLLQHLYDYDANKAIIIKNANGLIDVEYFYFEIKKKATYLMQQYCAVSPISLNVDTDGTSAIQLQNGTWHVRPLNEYLLFSSDNLQNPIRPKYIGQAIVRGIPVDQWDTCIIDRTQWKTIRRRWSFAQRGVIMPIGVVGDLAVPVQALISGSFTFPNGTVKAEVDEVFNVLSYKPGIIESNDALAPPKGVFCSTTQDSQIQNLVSLEDENIDWPNRFGVRVDASTSRTGQWQTFHLRFEQGRNNSRKRIRYDYMPDGAQDYRTVIHDYVDSLTYIMDRRTGSCEIKRGVEFGDVSPIRHPIDFFIKHEAMLITDPPKKAWEFNGIRSCRGKSIQCTIFTTSKEAFPALVDPSTGDPSGETWSFTNIEVAWSMRSPTSIPPPGRPKRFDYPVHIYMKMFRLGPEGIAQPFNVRTEDFEYEFFEMAHDISANEFDTSRCIRALNLPYLHLGFTLKLKKGSLVDGNHIDRLELDWQVRSRLAETMGIDRERVNDLELDHDRVDNSIFVLFTLLGPAPQPIPTLKADSGLSVDEARGRLNTALNSGNFNFDLQLIDDNNTKVQFMGAADSLKGTKQFMSAHANGRRIEDRKYTKGATAGAIIGGLIVGVIFGIIVIAIVRIARKEPMPDIPGMNGKFSMPNPIVKYKQRQNTPANGSNTKTETTDA